METNRTKVYIDGGNTYKALFTKSINAKGEIVPPIVASGKKFDFSRFVDFLSSPSRILCGKSYYVGIVRDFDNTEKSRTMVKGQQKFLAKLQNEGFVIERGKIVYDHQIREKGVDVKIAIDMVIDGIEDKYDTAILISSDTDLVPAIKYIQSKGKKVEYIGFSNRTSTGLMKVCDEQRVLGATELQVFINQN